MDARSAFPTTPQGYQLAIDLDPDPTLRTRLEVQVPVGWSESSIQVQANYGAFSPGSTVYLFVIREDGSVSDGRALQL